MNHETNTTNDHDFRARERAALTLLPALLAALPTAQVITALAWCALYLRLLGHGMRFAAELDDEEELDPDVRVIVDVILAGVLRHTTMDAIGEPGDGEYEAAFLAGVRRDLKTVTRAFMASRFPSPAVTKVTPSASITLTFDPVASACGCVLCARCDAHQSLDAHPLRATLDALPCACRVCAAHPASEVTAPRSAQVIPATLPEGVERVELGGRTFVHDTRPAALVARVTAWAAANDNDGLRDVVDEVVKAGVRVGDPAFARLACECLTLTQSRAMGLACTQGALDREALADLRELAHVAASMLDLHLAA